MFPSALVSLSIAVALGSPLLPRYPSRLAPASRHPSGNRHAVTGCGSPPQPDRSKAVL